MFKNIWNVLSIAIGLLGVVLAVVFFLSGREIQKPSYAVTSTKLIAENEGRLKIFWDDKEVKKAISTSIAIWNGGSKFIDKKDISTTEPIRIVPNCKVDILAANIYKTSRPNLTFDKIIDKDKDGNQSIILNIKGDEALEKNDGAIIQILFSGSNDCSWKVDGRIKGVIGGFRVIDNQDIKELRKGSETVDIYGHRFSVFFLLIIGISVVIVIPLVALFTYLRKLPTMAKLFILGVLFGELLTMLYFAYLHYLTPFPSWIISFCS